MDGVPSLGKQILLNSPSIDPEKAGARPAILASLYLGVLIIAFSVPLGVGTAVYLEEYARKERWYNRLLEVNIQNLAAVPSIVYGILGLAFIVRGIDLGRVLLAGAIILTLRRAAHGDRRLAGGDPRRARLDPPGRLRARRDEVAGRLAPGAARLDPRDRDGLDPVGLARDRRDRAAPPRRARSRSCRSTRRSSARTRRCRSRSSSGSARPQEEFKFLAAAAIIVLLAMLLTLNAFAIWLRNRYQKKW